jgi:hypothetical protein
VGQFLLLKPNLEKIRSESLATAKLFWRLFVSATEAEMTVNDL